MNTDQSYNEPSAELQQLANKFVKNHPAPCRPDNKLLTDWCEHLQTSSPHTLDLPVMQLIKAIVRAGKRHKVFTRPMHAIPQSGQHLTQY